MFKLLSTEKTFSMHWHNMPFRNWIEKPKMRHTMPKSTFFSHPRATQCPKNKMFRKVDVRCYLLRFFLALSPFFCWMKVISNRWTKHINLFDSLSKTSKQTPCSDDPRMRQNSAHFRKKLNFFLKSCLNSCLKKFF